QRSNSAHRARRRIDAFTATEDRLPPLDSIAHPPGARPGINKSQTVWLGDRMKTLSTENSTTVPQERLPAGCASIAKASIRSRSPSTSRETFTRTSVTLIRLSNPNPSDRNDELGRSGSYVDGIARVQRGTVGDI